MSLTYQSLYDNDAERGLAAIRQSGARLTPYRKHLDAAIKAEQARPPELRWRTPKPEEARSLPTDSREIPAGGCWIILEALKPDTPEETFEAFAADQAKVTAHEDLNQRAFHQEVRASAEEPWALYLDRLPQRESAADSDENPKSGIIRLVPNTYPLDCQRRALAELQNNPSRHHRPLLDLAIEGRSPSPVDLAAATNLDWKILRDNRDGTDEQRRFVQTALATADFAVLDGPPGSGKTTAICELIIQQVLKGQGGRVLLAASTHVAVDNVLERLIDWQRNKGDGLINPIRIGNECRIGHEVCAEYSLGRRRETYRRELSGFLANSGSGTPAGKAARDLLADALKAEDGGATLDRLVLENANLVCGTTIGLLQHPDIRAKTAAEKKGEHHPFRPFDLLILDEASKTTFTEFLVPALLAKRWVVVGDIRQLSPYVDTDALAASLSTMLPLGAAPESVEKLAERLIRAQGLRRGDPQPYRQVEAEIDKLLAGLDGAPQIIQDIRRVALPSILDVLTQGVGGEPGWNGSVLSDGLPATEYKCVPLSFQHRMHPDISAFPREEFYSPKDSGAAGLLNDADDMRAKRERDWDYNRYTRRAAWIDAPYRPHHGESETENATEVEVALDELDAFLRWARKHPRHDEKPWEVAILTFYRAQEHILREALRKAFRQPAAHHSFKASAQGQTYAEVRLGTVDRFQGHEADLVILSLVRKFTEPNQRVGFLDSPNRLDVALTRARYQLILIGHRQGFAQSKSPLLARLAESLHYARNLAFDGLTAAAR